MTANWKTLRTTLVWLLVAVMTLGIVIASPYMVKSDAASPKASTVTVAKASNGKWGAVKNGKIDKSVTGVYKNQYGWWYVKNGLVQFDYNGIQKNQYGWWRIEKGKVNFSSTGVYKNEYGWWCVEKGKVNFKANSIYKNEFGWWKTTDGKVTFKENGVFKNEFGWWKVEDSKVNFKFTGIASNQYGTWYLENGKVDFSANGAYSYQGKNYYVKDGKATEITQRMRNAVADAQATIAEVPCSRAILLEALTDKEVGYTRAEAEYGVDNAGINWNTQAKRVADEYLKEGVSREGLKSYLKDLEEFKDSEVNYAMHEVDKEAASIANYWVNQAVLASSNYLFDDDLNCNGFSRTYLKELLKEDLFTPAEIDGALKVVDEDAKKDKDFWNKQAVACAKELIEVAKENNVKYTAADLKKDLTEAFYFTTSEADYAVAHVNI